MRIRQRTERSEGFINPANDALRPIGVGGDNTFRYAVWDSGGLFRFAGELRLFCQVSFCLLAGLLEFGITGNCLGKDAPY